MRSMEKLLARKKQSASPLSDVEQRAKMDVMKDLRSVAQGEMKDKVGGLKKVSVMAPDQEGLEKGLDKAKELVEGSPEEESQESPEHEAAEQEGQDELMNGEEDSDMSEEDLDKELSRLMEMKARLRK